MTKQQNFFTDSLSPGRLGGEQARHRKQIDAIIVEIKQLITLKKQVEVLAMKVSEKEELIDMQPCSDRNSPWYRKHQEYVLAKCAFY